MTISLDRARDYVFTHGMLWERALFSWRFDDGPLEQLQRCLLCYKNADGGWGHGLEHDLKAPLSHPAALEYLLGVLRYHDIPPGTLLDGTVAWLERQQLPDGSLLNPTELGKWPLAPWWTEWGGAEAAGFNRRQPACPGSGHAAAAECDAPLGGGESQR